MNVEMDIVEPARQRLEEVLKRPVKAKAVHRRHNGPDGVFQAGKFVFVVEAKASNRLASIRQACEQARRYASQKGPNAIPLVAVPFMGPSGRRACEEAQVGFVDAAGNAHIEVPGLLVHIEGRPNASSVLGRPSTIFAPRSSRVSRLLLLDPNRWWQQKDIVLEAGIGRGFVSKIVARLNADGLLEVNDGKMRPSNPNLLLDAWKDEYDFSRHRVVAGHVSARSGEELADRIAQAAQQHEVEYSFTGLPAAAKLAPFAGFRLVAAYLRRPPTETFLQSLGFHADDKGANLWLIVPADEGVFAGSKAIAGHACVSPVQAYLDLLNMPERAKEAAEYLREVCLKWR
jgi:hypothetical protein